MNRGSQQGRLANRKKVCRFNEAPIHESGKSSGDPTDPPRGNRFNEAPIHESGK